LIPILNKKGGFILVKNDNHFKVKRTVLA